MTYSPRILADSGLWALFANTRDGYTRASLGGMGEEGRSTVWKESLPGHMVSLIPFATDSSVILSFIDTKVGRRNKGGKEISTGWGGGDWDI